MILNTNAVIERRRRYYIARIVLFIYMYFGEADRPRFSISTRFAEGLQKKETRAKVRRQFPARFSLSRDRLLASKVIGAKSFPRMPPINHMLYHKKTSSYKRS
ncbi:hypothetical protein F444_15472 [Phytophthora nicotianae P1976]|uniref:Uncharacterized protein n=1 Tax=Phytophthora nicotianae P1976 TaxID=1317066 RepID=A0A080ZLW2_PHYNI|nr:hypothetical protein F444_15472 [Phytophthora nicotianae P1976]